MGQQCNSYGFTAGFAAIFTGIACYLVQSRECKINVQNLFSDTFSEDHLQTFHYITISVGAVVFVLSFLDFAAMLSDILILFYTATVAILGVGVATFYATWIAFNMSCKSVFNNVFDTSNLVGRKNVIEANDEVGILITVLDLLAACLLLATAISFGKRP